MGSSITVLPHISSYASCVPCAMSSFDLATQSTLNIFGTLLPPPPRRSHQRVVLRFTYLRDGKIPLVAKFPSQSFRH